MIGKKTLTVLEAHKTLEEHGMKISVDSLRNGIEEGVFSFGTCIHNPKAREFIIYPKLLDDWIAERLG